MNFLREIALSVLVVCCIVSVAQDPSRKHSIGVYQNFTDYNVSLLTDKVFAFDSALSQSVRVAYQRRLSHNWMLNTGVTNGFILNQNLKESFVDKAYAVGIDASVLLKMNNGKLLKETARFAPFLSFGYRTEYVPRLRKDYNVSPWLAHNQYGAGFNVRLAERSHVQLQAILDQKLQDDFNTHMLYRLGLTQSLGKYDEIRPKSNPILDSDLDGIVDKRDNCPGLFGLKENNGCPDTAVYFANKIKLDSLALLAENQRAFISELELQNAMLRNGSSLSDKESIKENELLKQEYENKLTALNAKLKEEQNKPQSVRIDTVYKETIVYREATVDSNRLAAEKLDKERRDADAIRAKLEKERELAKLEREKNAQLEIIRQEEEAKTAQQERERLARAEQARLEERKRQETEKREADRLARLEQQKDKDFTDGPVTVDANMPVDKNYYIITISSPNISTAESWLAKMITDFPGARILPQPNGYFRVGVYGAKDRAYSLKILEQVKAKGYNPVWLSVE